MIKFYVFFSNYYKSLNYADYKYISFTDDINYINIILDNFIYKVYNKIGLINKTIGNINIFHNNNKLSEKKIEHGDSYKCYTYNNNNLYTKIICNTKSSLNTIEYNIIEYIGPNCKILCWRLLNTIKIRDSIIFTTININNLKYTRKTYIKLTLIKNIEMNYSKNNLFWFLY